MSRCVHTLRTQDAKRDPFIVLKKAHLLCETRPIRCAKKDVFFVRKEVHLTREKRPIDCAKRVPLMVRKEAHLSCEKRLIYGAKRVPLIVRKEAYRSKMADVLGQMCMFLYVNLLHSQDFQKRPEVCVKRGLYIKNGRRLFVSKVHVFVFSKRGLKCVSKESYISKKADVLCQRCGSFLCQFVAHSR